jgi:hypothetical protein
VTIREVGAVRIPVAELGEQHDIRIAFDEVLAIGFCCSDALRCKRCGKAWEALIPAEAKEVRGMKDDVMAGDACPLFLTRDFRRVPSLKDGWEGTVGNTFSWGIE